MAYNTKEMAAAKQYLLDSGVPHRVTCTWGGKHAINSRHYQGLAIDVAGPTPDSDGSPDLLAIFTVLSLVKDETYELFYGGAGGALLKRGVPFTNATLQKSHRNHVHLSVDQRVLLTFPFKEHSMPDNPDLPNISGPATFHPLFDSAGKCTGYYIFSTETAELHSFGPGAEWYSRSEVLPK